MSDEPEERTTPGTASPARIRKAACGIRFDEDELQEGIDFSRAVDLRPEEPICQEESSVDGKQRQKEDNS